MTIERMRVALLWPTGMGCGALAAPAAAGQKIDGQKIDGQKIDGQKIDGQKIDGQYICVCQPSLVAKGNVKAEAAKSAGQGKGALKDGGYAPLPGTSMGSPHMAGLLLLGTPRRGGTVTGDPDGNPDTIGIN